MATQVGFLRLLFALIKTHSRRVLLETWGFK
ncbi:MAG: hypothetical protein RLZZ125_518 [Actinomycetota bacterium]